LVFRHLADGGMGIPARFESRLWQHCELLRERNRQMEAELKAIVAALEGEGIRVVCLKGPVVARLVFGDAGLREYGDLDILVPVPEIHRAPAVLHRRGYQSKFPMTPAAEKACLRSPAQYHFVLSQGPEGILVEMHWKTDGEFPVEDLLDSDWWLGLVRTRLDDQEVSCLSPREMLLALLLHGSKHYWSSLHWFTDVAELSRSSTAADFDWLLVRTEKLRARRRVVLGLLLLQAHAGLQVSWATSRWPKESADMAAVAERIGRRWFESEPGVESAWQRLRLDLALCDSYGQRYRCLGNAIFRPGLAEWSRWPLPPWLFFLYLPLRLGRLITKSVASLGPRMQSANRVRNSPA